MTNEFTVVGEHKNNELHLLVLGADGGYYEYDPLREVVHPVEPDEETWTILHRAEPEDIDGPPPADLLHAAP